MSQDLNEINWLTPEGKSVTCLEKLKLLTEGLIELREMAQDLLEDAILMDCDEAQFRRVLSQLLAELENPYRPRDSQS